MIEDNFAGPRPALDEVGVTFAPDVDPYEEAKIRILNGGHTCLSYLGAPAGHDTFGQAMTNPVLRDHFWRYERDEVLPTISIPLPFDKSAYLGAIAARFENRYVGDTIKRICTDGYAKFPVFIRPTLEGCFECGIEPTFGLRSVASWYVFARRVISQELNVAYNEPSLPDLQPMLAPGGFRAFAISEQLWVDLPQRFPMFKQLLARQIEEVEASWPV